MRDDFLIGCMFSVVLSNLLFYQKVKISAIQCNVAYKILKLYLKELFIAFAHKAVEAPVSILILPN